MNYIEKLKAIAAGVDKHNGVVVSLADYLLDKDDFQIWSGSASKNKHHYGTGGLLVHTYEVVDTGLQMLNFYSQYDIDDAEFFLAALYHDTGKMRDYACVDGVWQGTDHKRYIHHISRSVIIWHQALETFPIDHINGKFRQQYADSVTHAILSHHGRREFGSPVAPKSRVAWLLHLCDSISARLNDAERNNHGIA